jgi:hypothetical protein
VPPHCGRTRPLRSRARSRSVATEPLAELTPSDLVARVGATPRRCWGHDCPLHDGSARALGRCLLLTTHFSGADKAKHIGALQLIPGVRPTAGWTPRA